MTASRASEPVGSPSDNSPADYLQHNRETYNQLAPEYENRVESDVINDLPIVFRFWSHLRHRFGDRVSLLDLGCGHGVNLAMFQRLGATTTGLDFSPKMIDVSTRTSPASQLILGEFLSCPLPRSLYQAVFAKAFIHLFPESECVTLFDKLRHLLVARGLLYIATTPSDKSFEGYFPKSDYPNSPSRFRRVWSERDLLQSLFSHNFRLIDRWTNEEVGRNKHWLNIVVEATNGK